MNRRQFLRKVFGAGLGVGLAGGAVVTEMLGAPAALKLPLTEQQTSSSCTLIHSVTQTCTPDNISIDLEWIDQLRLRTAQEWRILNYEQDHFSWFEGHKVNMPTNLHGWLMVYPYA